MSGYIAFVDATQKYKKIKLLNRNIDLENEVTENEIKWKESLNKIFAWVSKLQSSK